MQSFLRALSIKAIIITVLVCFALLLSAVATLGYINGTLSRKELNIQIRNTSRIALLSDADRMRLRTTILIRGRETTAFFDKPMDAQQKKKHQEAIQHLFEASHRSLAEFRALPPFPDEEGRKLLEEAATVLNDVLIGLDSQYQAWLEGDAEAYHEREDKFKSLGYGPKISKAMADATSYFKSYSDQHQAAHHASLMRFFTVGSVLLVVAALLLLALRAMLLGLVVRPVHEAVGHVQRLARADLSQAIPVGSGNEIGQLLGALREMQDSLVRIVGSVRAGSGSILVGAQQIAGGNADLSSRTEQQAASLEETAASMEELTATVKQNADNARQASALANDASGTAGQGREVVGRVVETMREISDSSQQIAKIVGVIDSIAFQTNILALNASVEAARAGEQGRGFAVVAGEVRNLAGRSAEAAREIKALIEASTKRVGDGSQLAEQAGRTMEEVVRSVHRVTDIIDEISAASHEQSEGLGQVNTAVAQMDEVTQQNAALVQEASAASSSLAEQARHLEEAVAVFRLSAEQQRAQPQEVRGERRAASQPAQASRAEKHQPSPAKERARPAAAVAEEQWEEF